MAAKNEQVAEIKESAKDADGATTDRVLAISRHADATPAQTPGFKSVDPDRTREISERQLTEQAVSAVDHAIRSAQADDVEPVEDPVNKALREAHEAAADAGAKKAQAEKY